jgi:Fe2+ transport system protein FeoA
MRFGKRNRTSRASGRDACEGCTLDTARKGEEFEVLEVGDENARVHALRFGMAEGACVRCVTRIPAGPIVVRSGRQEVAIGRGLARRIRVRRVWRGGASPVEGLICPEGEG